MSYTYPYQVPTTDSDDLYGNEIADTVPVAIPVPPPLPTTPPPKIQDLLDKRKTQTTTLVMELLNEFYYVKEKKILRLMLTCLTHTVTEFSDIDWTNVASTEHNKLVTINRLLIQCKYYDVMQIFLDNNLLDPCAKDINGDSLEELTEKYSDNLSDRFINIVKTKVIEQKKTEISALKTICSNK